MNITLPMRRDAYARARDEMAKLVGALEGRAALNLSDYITLLDGYIRQLDIEIELMKRMHDDETLQILSPLINMVIGAATTNILVDAVMNDAETNDAGYDPQSSDEPCQCGNCVRRRELVN